MPKFITLTTEAGGSILVATKDFVSAIGFVNETTEIRVGRETFHVTESVAEISKLLSAATQPDQIEA